MQNKVLVSIIIPVYNIEQYLEEYLDSVIKQSYGELQVIIINDGSTDGTGKICDTYALKDSQIEVMHTKNQGVSRAGNTGLELARGEYIIFVDGDDVIGGDYVKNIVEYIDKYKFDLMLYLRFYVYGKENTLNKNNHNDTVVGCYHNYLDVLDKLGENQIGAWSVCQIVIKHELIETYTTTFSSQYIRAEDLDFLMKIIKHVKLIYICEYYYRVRRDGSEMSDISRDKRISELRVAYHYYQEYEKTARKW